MSWLNIACSLVPTTTLVLIAIFATMIENARKSYKENHTYDLSIIVESGNVPVEKQNHTVALLGNLLERHFCHNRVLSLKMAMSILLTLMIFAWALVGYGYYYANNTVINAGNIIKNACSGNSELEGLLVDISLLPIRCYIAAIVLTVIAVVSLIIVAIRNHFPQQFRGIINPLR